MQKFSLDLYDPLSENQSPDQKKGHLCHSLKAITTATNRIICENIINFRIKSDDDVDKNIE